MKATFQVNPKLSLELEGKDQKDLFKELAKSQEIFSLDTCGLCGCKNIRYVVRNVEDNDFYELVCQDVKCRAKLAFGQHKKGNTMFPKLKDEKGYLPNRGWTKYIAPPS